MADVNASTSVESATPKKSPKKGAAKSKATRTKSSHPTTAIMVNEAIKNLKERSGSSLQAIKKYMATTYTVDAERLAPFIKKYIKASVASGTLVQTKGKGASGSFKLAGATTKAPTSPKAKKAPAKKPVAKKPAVKPKVVEKVVAPVSPKKTAAAKKPASPKKSPVRKAVIAKPKSPVKAKKAPKSPIKKAKSPTVKVTKPKAAAKTKKASPKKK